MAAAICFAATQMAYPQPEEKPFRRVLVVYENESTQVAAMEIARGLGSGLLDRDPTQFEIYTEYLDNARFPEPGNLVRMSEHLAKKYASLPLDIVIAAGPTAMKFMLDHRAQIAPGVPMLFGAVARSIADAQNLPADVYGVITNFDLQGTLRLAKSLHPNATNAVVITGDGAFDRLWEKAAWRDLGDNFEGLSIDYISQLTLDGFKDVVRRLGSNTIVLPLTIFETADGRKYVPRDVAAMVAEASSAPVYVVYDTYLGSGAIGGRMDTFEGIGQKLASVASSILRGDIPENRLIESAVHPVFDWREVERWGISKDLIPKDAELRFFTPSVWQQYSTEIGLTVALLSLQSAMIVALVVQRHRRKLAEAELATGQIELAHLSRASLLGALSGAFAHELNQPLTSILANTQAAQQLIATGRATPADLNEILADIETDDRRAATVIAQLRRLLTKGDTILENTDLNQVVVSTLQLVRSELLAKQVKIEFARWHEPVIVLANFAQLQQVVLNLIINAVDAVQDVSAPERLVEVAVRGRDKSGEIVVRDNGAGVSPKMMEDAFKPFVSTKPKGLGLGLSICRSIANAHGGSLRFDEESVSGAGIILSLPLGGQAHE
nr:ATP-binding protein [Mesorhizobium sp.]